jgi:hypothetical protein
VATWITAPPSRDATPTYPIPKRQLRAKRSNPVFALVMAIPRAQTRLDSASFLKKEAKNFFSLAGH